MDGLQGVPGLQVLARWRGELAGHQARASGGCCLQCAWARPGPWPGFAQCAHPDGRTEPWRAWARPHVAGHRVWHRPQTVSPALWNYDCLCRPGRAQNQSLVLGSPVLPRPFAVD